MFAKVIKNSIWQWGGKFLGLLFGFASTVLLLRYLGDQQYGYFTSVMAYLHFAVVLIDLGLYFVLVKRISDTKEDSNKVINNIFSLRLSSGLLALSLFAAVVWFLPYAQIIKWGVLISALNFLFILLIQVLTAIFQKHLKMGWVAIAESSSKLFLLLSTLSIIYFLKTGLYSIFLIVVLTAFINFIILFLAAQKYQKIKLAFDFDFWKQIIKESWPMGLSVAFSLAYFKGDTFLLSIMRPAAEVGIYGAVYKILEVLVTVPVIFVGLVLPILSKYYLEKNLDQFKKYLQKSFDLLTIIALPLIAGTLAIANPLMQAIVGKNFSDQDVVLGRILQILIFAVGIIFFNTLFTYLVVTVKQQKKMLWGYLFTALSSLILYLIFIPKYSYYGAAGVTIYSELCILIFSAWLIYKATKVSLDYGVFLRSLLATKVMLTVLILYSYINLIWLILIGVFVYCLLIYLLGAISFKQIKELFYGFKPEMEKK